MSRAKVIIATLSAGCFLFLAQQLVKADRLESNSYLVTFGNLNVTSGTKNSATYNVTDTVGQVANGPYGAYGVSGYFVGAGFQYIYQIDEFTFQITDVTVELGELNTGSHNTATHNLIINTKGAGGYLVYASEAHPLRHSNGTTTIPNTSCNSGTCTNSSAGIWNNVAIPGFGYNMSGHDIPADFVNSTYFRPFADRSAAETMKVVMSSVNVASNRTATVTYKAGIAGVQAAGDYQTSISYVAVPGF